jgi:UDP-N-acetylglucosamine 1-carboxyvinyltransferase
VPVVVRGPQRLTGTINVAGSKNAFHKLIAGCIAVPALHHLLAVPRTGDADALLGMAQLLGAKVTRKDLNVVIDSRSLTPQALGAEDTTKSTGSFLFAGALLGRFGHTEIGPPGGDQVGARPVDRHLEAFKALGARVEKKGPAYDISAERLTAGDVTFKRDTVNGTANTVLAAIGIEGTTTISNPSLDPDVVALIEFLRAAGYSIYSRNDCLVVRGRTPVRQETYFRVPPDRNDAATVITAAALCRGRVDVTGITSSALGPFLDALLSAGVVVEDRSDRLVIRGDLWQSGPAIHVESAPFPGFLTDWGPLVQVLMTQLRGVSTFCERVFTDRFGHLDEMQHMGAEVDIRAAKVSEQTSEHWLTAYIGGPVRLQGASVTGRDLRGVAALLLAGLVAHGTTVIEGAGHLNRGYEDLVPRLRRLGADIEV